MFAGASGTIPRFGVQKISFEFEYAPEQRIQQAIYIEETGSLGACNLTIPGHQKFWVRGERAILSGCDWEVHVPEDIYVHRTQPTKSFDDMLGPFGFPTNAA